MLSSLFLLSCLSSPWASPAGEETLVAAVEQPAQEPVVAGPINASDPWALRDAVAKAGLPWPPPDVRLTLEKPTRALTIWSGSVALKRYRVGLGEPEGDKVRQGDLRTPEGPLRIVTRNRNSQFHRFLGINYPTAEDADRGLAEGLITAGQAAGIRAAERAGRAPNWSTALGGAVGIHGGGGSIDWTLGCIAVENAEIDELWEVVPVGTPLEVSGQATNPLP